MRHQANQWTARTQSNLLKYRYCSIKPAVPEMGTGYRECNSYGRRTPDAATTSETRNPISPPWVVGEKARRADERQNDAV